MILEGKKILIMGIRNKWSIAFGIAKSAYENGAQLLFTSHDIATMKNTVFRRDEIWFVERDKDNNSTLYSLDRFKERYDKKLSKAYLEGRYGAIPVISKRNNY